MKKIIALFCCFVGSFFTDENGRSYDGNGVVVE